MACCLSQAIIWTNAGILLIGPLGIHFGEILIKSHTFSFRKMHLKNVVWQMSAILYQPQCVYSLGSGHVANILKHFKLIVQHSSFNTWAVNLFSGKCHRTSLIWIFVHVMAWWHQVTSHYLSQCWPRSMRQWVNSHRPYDTIWHCRGRSTLVQVIVCCLFGPKTIIWTNANLLSLDPRPTLVKSWWKLKNFHWRKCLWKCHL